MNFGVCLASERPSSLKINNLLLNCFQGVLSSVGANKLGDRHGWEFKKSKRSHFGPVTVGALVAMC